MDIEDSNLLVLYEIVFINKTVQKTVVTEV